MQGESIIIELYMPPGITGELLEIAFVVHDYRNIFDYGDSESCNNNVNCPEWSDWYDQKRSVGMLLLADNTRLCSGALINNAENEDTQYFLTAEHCFDNSGDQPGDQLNWIIMFNYESPGCENQDGPTDETVQGMIVRAMHHSSDFALLEVNNEIIPSDYDIFYSGWSRNAPVNGNTGIHHPSGDIKKISYAAGSATSYYGTHWLVSFTDGTMEHGSSGSPLFNSNYQIVGDLTGPPSYDENVPYCDQRTMAYGTLSFSWSSAGTNANVRLKDWLDPNNTNVQFIDGREGLSPLTLKTEYSDGSNLNEYLEIKRDGDPSWLQVLSGETIDVHRGDMYTERPMEQRYTYNDNLVQHHRWEINEQIITSHSLERYFEMADQTEETALFDAILPVTITTEHPVEIELHDPWFAYLDGNNQWVQPDDFRPLSEQIDGNGNLQVFLEQGEIDDPSSLDPIYRLRAPTDYDGSLSYTFSHWLVSPEDGATLLADDEEMTPVVFHNSAAEITAHYEAITLTLRAEHSDGSNLNEYLEIRRDGDSAWTQVLSGEAIGIRRSAMYRERPTQQRYTYNDGLVQHHHWQINDGEDSASYSLERYFEMADQTEETAIFDAILPVAITTEHPVEIELHDPWFAYLDTNDQWVQPDEFRPLSEQIDGNGNLPVFRDQNPDFNDTDPIYRLRAQSGYNEDPLCFVFDHWSVTPANGAIFADASAYETSVVFDSGGAEIEAIYTAENGQTGSISGTIENTILYDNVTIVGDAYIPEGTTVYAVPGTDITIGENGVLVIYGRFYSNGTQSDPIIFTGDGGLGIEITGPAIAYFRHCNFTDIVLHSSIDNGDPLIGVSLSICIIEHCTFENDSSVPLWIEGVHNRSTIVRNCQFSNSKHGILTGSWAKPEITGCTFTGNDVGIASTTHSKPLIRGCSFNGNNTGMGIYVNSSSAPKLWRVKDNKWACSANNNVFTQCNPAVWTRNESYPILGFAPGSVIIFPDGFPGGYGVAGWNRFHDNVIDIVNDNELAIYAIGNNWYPPNPPGLVGCSESEPDSTTGSVVWEPTVYGLVGNNMWTQMELPPARQAEGEGDFELALELYDDMVNNEQSVAAVYGVARCLWQQDDVGGIIDKMDEYSQAYPDSPIEEHSLSVLASYKLYLSGNINLNEALEHIDDIKLNYPTTELDPKLLFEEAQVHEKLQGSAKMIAGAQRERLPVKAKAAYTTLAEKYPDTPLGVLAAIMVGKQAKETTETIPSAYALYPAYPNPFNPITTIRYGLPESSDVSLIVYDITGREIIQLVDSRVPAGDRRVIWNGRDRQGNPVASGLYIYRLVAKSNETKQVFTQSNKMVLMK